MNIKKRFLIITTLILLLISSVSWFSMRAISGSIINDWVLRYAEKQVRYDKVRTLLPLIEELHTAKEFAQLSSLVNWANTPDDDQLKKNALEEVEAFRHRFAEKNYFIALQKNGHYYFNSNKFYKNDPFRYILSEDKKTDAWFYDFLKNNLDMTLNVNPDVELGVVKLWIDYAIRDGGKVIGVAGTGLDLSSFLNDMLEEQDVYSSIMFTNGEGAIQLYQQQDMIDYATLTKKYREKKLVFQLLDDSESRKTLANALLRAKATPGAVTMVTVNKGGREQLASVVYIPEIDWLQINFIDTKRFFPFSEFSGLLLILFFSLIFVLIIFYLLLKVIVTKPLREFELSIQSLNENRFQAPKLSRFAGAEIQRLVNKYQQMFSSILEYQQNLENKVAERTEELKRLSQSDFLTGLHNRRGFEVYLRECMLNWQENSQAFGLISVDINKFKQLNDKFGHHIGDLVLQKMADYLTRIIGSEGIVARWGGDEFLILVKQTTPDTIAELSSRIFSNENPFIVNINENDVPIEGSVGSAIIRQGDTIEDLLNNADKAMYAVKFSSK